MFSTYSLEDMDEEMKKEKIIKQSEIWHGGSLTLIKNYW